MKFHRLAEAHDTQAEGSKNEASKSLSGALLARHIWQEMVCADVHDVAPVQEGQLITLPQKLRQLSDLEQVTRYNTLVNLHYQSRRDLSHRCAREAAM